LLLSMLGQPAMALSCMRPSVAQTFQTLNAAEETYVIVHGTFEPLPGGPTEPAGDVNDRQSYDLQARFRGDLATAMGFDRSIDVIVTVEIGCAGPWCGTVPEGDVIAFLERREEGFAFSAGPCPFGALPATPEAEALALSCLRAGPCETAS
ncbi:MAG: hypothetical protein AAGF30_02005, partial [Pseudomonadota bacterium]